MAGNKSTKAPKNTTTTPVLITIDRKIRQMGRKHQNRRGKVGRRARARKAKNSETAEQMLGLVGGKFDAPPKTGDDSVISTKKTRNLPAIDQDETPAPPVEVKPSTSASKARHEELKRRGDERKRKLQLLAVRQPEISKPVSKSAVSVAKKTPEKTPLDSEPLKTPRVPKTFKPKATKTPKISAPADSGVSDKPRFGETVHAPSEKIAKLGKMLAAKLSK